MIDCETELKLIALCTISIGPSPKSLRHWSLPNHVIHIRLRGTSDDSGKAFLHVYGKWHLNFVARIVGKLSDYLH